MRNLTLLLLLLGVFNSMLFAQSNHETSLSSATNKLLEIVQSKEFLIQGTKVKSRKGGEAKVSPKTNFFLAKDSIVTLQVALKTGKGFNGLGGITLEGELVIIEVKEDNLNSQSLYFEGFIFGTALGGIDFYLDVNYDGGVIMQFQSEYGHQFKLLGHLSSINSQNIRIGKTTY